MKKLFLMLLVAGFGFGLTACDNCDEAKDDYCACVEEGGSTCSSELSKVGDECDNARDFNGTSFCD